MIKCDLDMCERYNNGICMLDEITIEKSYDCEYGYLIGGVCKNFKPKQEYLNDKSERTFKIMKISEDTYYAVRTSVFDDVDISYIVNKHPNIRTLITDNVLRQGSTKCSNRFWIFEIEADDIKETMVCDKYNKLITEDMLKFSCDCIRDGKNDGCLTSVAYKMIIKGINL